MLSRLYVANGRLPVAKAIRCKVNANEWNDKRKYAVFDFVIPECSLTLKTYKGGDILLESTKVEKSQLS